MDDTTLQRTITLAGLMKRWVGKRVGDYDLDFDGIKELVRQTDQLPAYILIRQLAITGGYRICRVRPISYPGMMRELTEKQGFYAVIFNFDDIEKFELDNFQPSTNSEQFTSVAAETNEADTSSDAEGLIHRELWGSREPKTVVNNMRAAKMPEDAIAFALKNGCAISNTDIGRMMYPNLSDRGWRDRVKKLFDKPTNDWKLE